MWEIVGGEDKEKLPIFSQTTVVPNTGNFTSNLHFSTGIRTPRPTPNFPEKVATKCVQQKTFEFRISRASKWLISRHMRENCCFVVVLIPKNIQGVLACQIKNVMYIFGKACCDFSFKKVFPPLFSSKHFFLQPQCVCMGGKNCTRWRPTDRYRW